jgi:hypothetical protein
MNEGGYLWAARVVCKRVLPAAVYGSGRECVMARWQAGHFGIRRAPLGRIAVCVLWLAPEGLVQGLGNCRTAVGEQDCYGCVTTTMCDHLHASGCDLGMQAQL